MLLCVSACIEYNPAGEADVAPSGSDDAVTSDSESEVADTDAAEACNGLDDDLDGVTDETFADEDGNGVVDCLECSLTAVVEEIRTTAPDCPTFTPPHDPWDVEVLWEFMPEERRGCRTAAGDVDGDGDVDIVAHCLTTTYLLDGRTGAVEWSATLLEFKSPVALGNLDGMPGLEIVGQNPDSKVVALTSDGSTHFRGAAELGDSFSATTTAISIVLVDLDRDGSLEIVSHRGIISGTDGSSLSAWDADPSQTIPVAVGDLDNDGSMEIASLGALHESDGDQRWDLLSSMTGSSAFPATPLILDVDSDGVAEVFWVGPDDVLVVTDAGVEHSDFPRREALSGGNLACAGDIDGDGVTELVISGYGAVDAFELDGTLLWTREIVDETTTVGCTTFDLDADGAREVILSTQDEVLILGGSTGDTLFSDEDWFSDTLNDLPLIVDVDGDHSAEIVVAASHWEANMRDTGRTAGVPVRVYTHAAGGWPDPGQFWPFDSWGGCLLNSDGTPRSTPCRPWADYGIWRGQPQLAGGLGAWGSDLQLELVDACRAESTYGAADARLSFRVVNAGPEDHNGDLVASVYLLDDAGEATLHQSIDIDTPLLLGQATASIEVALQRDDVEHGVLVTLADADGALPDADCQEDNNRLNLDFDEL